MSNSESSIRVNVDVTNPGQFFACCGLLELADRLWPGAEGWFEEGEFCIVTPSGNFSLTHFLSSLKTSGISNTMTDKQVKRRDELSRLSKKERAARRLENEKKELDKLWRERPVVLGPPFSLQIDWFLDEHAGGSRFKTWAGQQSVIDITNTMRECVVQGNWNELISKDWLKQPSDNESVPFNFDSNLGPQSSSLDVGYSLDALKMATCTRPMIEFCAFIGLQRFRPMPIKSKNLYRYRVWQIPLSLQVASIAACTMLTLPRSIDFEFCLLYRTKYLKSFLPATKIGV